MINEENIYGYVATIMYANSFGLLRKKIKEAKETCTNVDINEDSFFNKTTRDFSLDNIVNTIRDYYNAEENRLYPRSALNIMNACPYCKVKISDIKEFRESELWSSERALGTYNSFRRMREAVSVATKGMSNCCATPESIGIDANFWDKCKNCRIYLSDNLVEAIYAAQPTDNGFASRLQAILSDLKFRGKIEN